MMISASNLHQILNPMTDSESSFNSVFKSVPGSSIWKKMKGVMNVSKLLSETKEYFFETAKKI